MAIKKNYRIIIVLCFLATAVIIYIAASQKISYTESPQDKKEVRELSSIENIALSASSSTSWGMSPFGNGPTFIEIEPKKFRKPSTQWATKTVNGVSYVFGEGNPKEVAPKREEYVDDFSFLHDDVVSAQTEKNLHDFLSNPMLETVINRCGEILKSDMYADSKILRNLPDAIFEENFDIENILYVDTNRGGQKKINLNHLDAFGAAFSQISESITHNSTENASGRCLSLGEQAGFEKLISQYSNIYMSYWDGNMNNPQN